MLAGCGASTNHTVQLDTRIWTSGQNNGQVNVYFDHLPRNLGCGGEKPVQRAFDHSGIQFFELCGEASIFIPSKVLVVDGKMQRTLVANHEAFHLIVQLGRRASLRTRMDAISYVASEARIPDSSSLELVNTFYRAVISSATRDSTQCQEMRASYNALSDFDKGKVAWESAMEWPAEFYMANASNLDEERYLKFRTRELTYVGEDIKYLAGYYALKVVDSKRSRIAWQAEYAAGASPIDIFASTLNCGTILQPSALVSMKGT